MKKSFIFIGGVAVGTGGTIFLVVIALLMGVLSFNPQMASPTNTPVTITLPPTEAFTITPTATFIPSNTPNIITATLTSIPDCLKPTKGIYTLVVLSEAKDAFILRSTEKCMMFSTGRGSRGHAELGEEIKQSIKILDREFPKYFEFVIPIDKKYHTATLGVFNWSLSNWEWAVSGYDWVDGNCQVGKYCYLMVHIPSPTSTPSPAP